METPLAEPLAKTQRLCPRMGRTEDPKGSPASENDGHSESRLNGKVVSALPSFRPHIPQTLGFREP